MIQSSIELIFRPEKQPVCLLLDSPILLPIIIISYLVGNVLQFLTVFLTWVSIAAAAIWFIIFLKKSRDSGETEIRVFPDRIEIDVGMKNPKLTMIEYINLKEVKPTQTFIQSLFKTYSVNFIYKSDFDETKNIIYSIRDFTDTKPLCDAVKKAVDQANLARIKEQRDKGI